jgi:hypothetical protein
MAANLLFIGIILRCKTIIPNTLDAETGCRARAGMPAEQLIDITIIPARYISIGRGRVGVKQSLMQVEYAGNAG